MSQSGIVSNSLPEKEAIKIKAKIFWTQEGLYSNEAKKIASNAGLKVVMDQCPKKILENT